MKHKPCECSQPNGTCPRYGWMKGRKWDICRGVDNTAERRDELLDAYEYANTKTDSNPGIIQKAFNYAKSTVTHALDGFSIASPELLKIRLEICNSCDQLTPEQSCRACGCPVKEKAERRSEQCPLLKWPNDAEQPKGCGCGS